MSDPSPELFFETVWGYQRTAALKGALELDLFTAVGEGNATDAAAAARCGASTRGVRILCDYLTVLGFLVKDGDRYALTADSAAFLDRRSPAYLGGTIEFTLSPVLEEAFRDVAGAVRRGGTVAAAGGTVAPDHPVWVRFARAMMPMMRGPAEELVNLVPADSGRPLRVLDIAAGHGLFGIAFARRYPRAEVTAVDWAGVLEVARDNAAAVGVAERYRAIPGSAFDVEWGAGYDVALLTNFLHHFDPATCERMLARVHQTLVPGGRAVTLEFVPNADRVSPAPAAGFSLVMLCTTPAGDAYTFAELDDMLRRAGFTRNTLHPLATAPQQAIISVA
jgi:ubiquinone/menaquinone biosynthesis C-methylase UbiE